jgi:CRISPR/Cas system CSM-associated protein Csm2 small subunit
MEGYQLMFDDKLSTIWSAPNYCYRCGNKASILEINTNGEKFFNVFEAAPDNLRNNNIKKDQLRNVYDDEIDESMDIDEESLEEINEYFM